MALRAIRQAEHPPELPLADRQRTMSLSALLDWSLRGTHFVAVIDGGADLGNIGATGPLLR